MKNLMKILLTTTLFTSFSLVSAAEEQDIVEVFGWTGYLVALPETHRVSAERNFLTDAYEKCAEKGHPYFREISIEWTAWLNNPYLRKSGKVLCYGRQAD